MSYLLSFFFLTCNLIISVSSLTGIGVLLLTDFELMYYFATSRRPGFAEVDGFLTLSLAQSSCIELPDGGMWVCGSLSIADRISVYIKVIFTYTCSQIHTAARTAITPQAVVVCAVITFRRINNVRENTNLGVLAQSISSIAEI